MSMLNCAMCTLKVKGSARGFSWLQKKLKKEVNVWLNGRMCVMLYLQVDLVF
jgi:hypothetical protein